MADVSVLVGCREVSYSGRERENSMRGVTGYDE